MPYRTFILSCSLSLSLVLAPTPCACNSLTLRSNAVPHVQQAALSLQLALHRIKLSALQCFPPKQASDSIHRQPSCQPPEQATRPSLPVPLLGKAIQHPSSCTYCWLMPHALHPTAHVQQPHMATDRLLMAQEISKSVLRKSDPMGSWKSKC